MTDILKPELVWIEGRCYRVNDASSEITTFQEHDLYEDEVTYNNIEDEEDDFEVVMVDNSRFATNFHVSKHYIGSIIGKKGLIKNRIERDTKTDIKIPRHGQTGDVTIFGPTEASVKAARRRLDIIVMSSRMKQKSTHFISIPMNSDEIVNNFELFKEAVLKECSSSRGLEESIFIKAQKLHLTLGVMCLMDNEERVIVSKLLNEAKENIVMPLMKDKTPLKIRLKGLSYMNDDPKEIDVLYGQIQEEDNATGLIQVLTDVLVNYFNKAGFMNREFERQNVKLHVTFMNSKYRSRSSSFEESSDSRRLRQKETFDGSEVLSKFANYDFGVAELREIHLSQRHSIGPDGYYQSTHVISCTDE